jgi:hypothetical protein
MLNPMKKAQEVADKVSGAAESAADTFRNSAGVLIAVGVTALVALVLAVVALKR